MASRPSPASALTITGITAARQDAGTLGADGLLAVLGIVVIQLSAALRTGLPNPFNYWHRLSLFHCLIHASKIDVSDSCSAPLTTSQRCHATGSINSMIALSTQARRSLGSIASSSQQRSP
jgi:hypothetical protein